MPKWCYVTECWADLDLRRRQNYTPIRTGRTHVENDVRVAIVELAVEIFRPVGHLELL